MIDEFLNEIKELQEYKKKYLYAVKDKQCMSDLLYEYMTKEYKRMSKQKRIESTKKNVVNAVDIENIANLISLTIFINQLKVIIHGFQVG